MTTLRISCLVLAMSAIVAPGCVVATGENQQVVGADDGEPGAPPPGGGEMPTDTPPPGGSTSGIITGNGAHVLTPELLSLWAPIARALTLVPLSPSALELSDLIGDLDGRTFLHYAVKCALPEGQKVSAVDFGVTYTFEGHVGVAPEWLDGGLSDAGRRWLSACMLAHVNATGTQVSILLRGDHPALGDPEGGSPEGYTLREGAFYGDIFGVVPREHACVGEGTTPARKCTNSVAGVSPCGFIVPGDCRGIDSACEGLDDGVYETCHSGLILPVVPSTAYAETITVYLKP